MVVTLFVFYRSWVFVRQMEIDGFFDFERNSVQIRTKTGSRIESFFRVFSITLVRLIRVERERGEKDTNTKVTVKELTIMNVNMGRNLLEGSVILVKKTSLLKIIGTVNFY